MKKISLLLLIVWCFLIVGCQSDIKTAVLPKESKLPTATTTPKPKPVFKLLMPDWVELGMQEGEVRKHYNEKPYEYKNTIAYYAFNRMKIDTDKEYMISYGFTEDNKLILLSYTIGYNDSVDSNAKDYTSTYNNFKKQLVDKYGEPKTEDEKWKNKRYKEDNTMFYKAVESNDYIRKTIWENNGTYISLSLDGKYSINYTNVKSEL